MEGKEWKERERDTALCPIFCCSCCARYFRYFAKKKQTSKSSKTINTILKTIVNTLFCIYYGGHICCMANVKLRTCSSNCKKKSEGHDIATAKPSSEIHVMPWVKSTSCRKHFVCDPTILWHQQNLWLLTFFV